MNKYKNEIDNMVWSHSSLTAFENCKYEFYLNYLVNNPQIYTKENNYYAELGSYIHKILEMVFTKKISLKEAAEYFADNYDDNISHYAKQATMNKCFEKCTDYFQTMDFTWFNNYDVLGVESEISFKIQQYNFVAHIDLLLRDKQDNKTIIVDHKSSKYPFNNDGKIKDKCKTRFLSYQRQMYLYCCAVKNKYKEFPKAVVWNHFKDGGKFVKEVFNESSYEETLQWAIDTIHKIENEATFEPTESSFYCHSLCGFRRSCEYAEQ